jgi:hypothetical protein
MTDLLCRESGDRYAEFAEGVRAGVDRPLAVADEIEGTRSSPTRRSSKRFIAGDGALPLP